MRLKFIGTDGSMGLTHGKTYTVQIYSAGGYIYVDWGMNRCPYGSPQDVADNWKKET